MNKSIFMYKSALYAAPQCEVVVVEEEISFLASLESVETGSHSYGEDDFE